MKPLLVLFYCISFSPLVRSQEIEISNKVALPNELREGVYSRKSSSGESYPHVFEWQLLDSLVDLKAVKFLATIHITGKVKTNGKYFYDIDDKVSKIAMQLDANSFKVSHFSFNDSSRYFVLTLDAFHASDSLIFEVERSKPKNVICFFPYLRGIKNKTGFYIDGKRMKAGYRQHFLYQLKTNKSVKFQKLTDIDLVIEWGDNKAATYLTTGGLTFDPYLSKEIYHLSEGFGELLTKTIFNKSVYFQR
jgi:hypothetical protein